MDKRYLAIFVVCAVIAVIGIVAFINVLADNVVVIEETTTEKPIVTTTKKETPTTEKVVTMKDQFISLGFTEAEAEEMEKIFTTVGITEISNIEGFGTATIDELKMFKCDIYDYRRDKGGVSVHFTIDKRQLCFISLDGVPSTKTDYAYINIFGNVKYKTSNTSRSITLYDKWNEDGEIDESAVGYKAVFDYENKKITEYDR